MARRFRVSSTSVSSNVVKQQKLPTQRRKRQQNVSTTRLEVCQSTVKAMEDFMKKDSSSVPELWCAG